MSEPLNNTDAELLNVLPPALEAEEMQDDGPDFGDELHAPTGRPLPTSEQLDVIADKLLMGAAKAGALALPEPYREEYTRAYMKDELGLVRAALHFTGATAAVYDLTPGAGGDAAGAVPQKPVHPVLRLLGGVAALAVAGALTRWSVLNAHKEELGTVHAGGAPAAAGGSQSVQAPAWSWGGKNARK